MVVAGKVQRTYANCEIVKNIGEYNCANSVKMNSVIVLDSDSEDEAPSKKMRISHSIPATITPIKAVKATTTTTPRTIEKAATTIGPTAAKMKALAKIRTMPKGITITQQNRPTALLSDSPSEVQFSTGVGKSKTSPPPKWCSISTTPPQSTAMPSLSVSSSRIVCSSSAVSSVGPLITSVQSMTASTTPPLQLLATPPPHSYECGTPFNESPPQMCYSDLSESSIVTLELSPTNSHHCHNNNNNNNNNNKNNFNSNSDFKIHLPVKRSTSTTSSPAVSPIAKASSSPASPTSMLAANANNIVSNSSMNNNEKTIRRIKPTTLLKNSDEAWLKRQHPQSPATATPAKLYKTVNANNAKCIAASSAASSPHSMVLGLTIASEKKNFSNVMNKSYAPEGPKLANTDQIAEVKLNGESRAAASEAIETESILPSVSRCNEDQTKLLHQLPIEEDFAKLIKTCRNADVSADMERLIETKLMRYYNEVHHSFVHSRGFRKNVRAVTALITTNPNLVYYNLKTIVDELKVRRKVKVEDVNATNDDDGALNADDNGDITSSTGNKRTDEQIRKLNKALYILNKRIVKLEEAEVDWEDDDSTYVQMERFKKRACQIYEKICDLTGENKSAHRLAKKPISFTGTAIPQFNRILQAYINRTCEFPDYYDVVRMLEHCNSQYNLNLVNFEIKNIAQDAFLKVGKLLQTRRRNDLYETVTHFTANTKDPATTDAALLAKLSENQKQQTKISDIINKYATLTAEELKEEQEAKNAQKRNEQLSSAAIENGKNDAGDDDDDDDDDDDEDDDDYDDEEVNTIDEDVDKWTSDIGVYNAELSDVEDDYIDFKGIVDDAEREQLLNAKKDNIAMKSAASDKTDIFLTITSKSTTATKDAIKTSTILEKKTNTTTPTSPKATAKVATSTSGGAEKGKACDNISSKQPMRSKTGGNITKQPQPNGKLKEQCLTDPSSSLRIVSVTSLQLKEGNSSSSSSNSSNSNSSNSNSSNSNSSSCSTKKPTSGDVARNVIKVTKYSVAQRCTTMSKTVKVPPAVSSTVSTTSCSTPTIAPPTNVNAKSSSAKSLAVTLKQRTVDEIVISDEES